MKRLFLYLVMIMAVAAAGSTGLTCGDCGVEIKKINASNTDEMAPFIYLDRRTDSEIMYFLSVNEAGAGANANKHSDIYFSSRRILKSTDTYSNTWNYPSFMKWCKNDESLMRNLNLGPVAVYANDMIISMESQPFNGGYKNSHNNNPNFDLYSVSYNSGNLACRTPLVSINAEGYWDSHPAFSADGSILYFASDRPGGKGGTDIYYVKKGQDGSWGFPKNLDAVNTPGNEASPHVGYDGLFYFSSDWNYEKNLPSTSGKNIQVAAFSPEGFPTQPKNLDLYVRDMSKCPSSCTEYNTKYDDEFPFVSFDKSYIYISSADAAGKYNIRAYSLYKPSITLKVSFTDVVTDDSGAYLSQNFRNESAFFKVTDAFGKTTVYTANEIISLDPDSRYKVEPDYNLDKCKNGEILGQKLFIINTAKPAGCDTLIEKLFSFKGSFRSMKLDLSPKCFVTGYWKPMTLENFNEFTQRASDGYFRDFPVIDKNYDDNEQAYKNEEEFSKLYVSLDKFIRDNYECLSFDGMKLRIVLNTFAFTSGIQSMTYPDADVTTKNFTIKSGDKFADEQKGNITLSRLRAFYTSQALHNIMSARSNFYKSIYAKGRIEYVLEGYGVSGAAFGAGDKTFDANNIDIYADLAPIGWIANSYRTENGRLGFKQQEIIAHTEKKKDDNVHIITSENSVKTENTSSTKVLPKDNTTTESSTKKPEDKTVTKKPEDKTVTKKTEDKKETKITENKTVTKKPEDKTVTKKTEDKKVTKITENKTVTKKPEDKTVTKKTEDKKVTKITENKTVTKKPEDKKETKIADNKPVYKKTVKPKSIPPEKIKEKMVAVKDSTKKIIKPVKVPKKTIADLSTQPVENKKKIIESKDKLLAGKKIKDSDISAEPVTKPEVKKKTPLKKAEVKSGTQLKASYTLNNSLKDYESFITDYQKSDKYSVTLGAYVRQSNCANLIGFLKNNGVEGLRIVPITKNKKTYYRVRIGLFDTMADAQVKAGEIRAIVRKAKIGAPVAVVQD